ncbi:alpha-L-arabinofuranosidase C-terminal domain-containing protein [Terriglobus sp. 2YAB30_2]|uniref:alpha-L-arabinofuranosidase C-terminal domain-containing protein n=1 Tax=Terriglobus sp. 2YAB30_2 TaxID=3233023 RepID=UPI003F9D376A
MNPLARTVLTPLIASVFLGLGSSQISAQSPTLKVETDAILSPVSPTLYGLMTEEINYSYDGGLYAELIRNRTFQHRGKSFASWLPASRGNGEVEIDAGLDGPGAALSSSMKVTIKVHGAGDEAGVANTGFWGMGVKPSTTYAGGLYAKAESPMKAHIRLIADQTGEAVAEATADLSGAAWKQYEFKMTSKSGIAASAQHHLEILFDQPGTVSLQLVSVMGPTYHNRANGNRPDLMELMAAMKPNFLRLPGGNYLEGDTIKERFNWKETIGPLVDRPTHRSPWNYTSSDGLGLLEFLEWCEDLKIEPVLAVYAGYSLKGEHVTGKDLEPFIQDALDEIEYVTGDTSTKWGAVRAKNGHPAAFPLHYIEIGNEDYFDKSGSYDERFQAFAKAIRAKYPQYKLISTAPNTKGDPDVQDDHYYRNPEEMFLLVHKYDDADRKGPKIFVGEWATRTGSPTPDFGAALGDAAFMAGMERNSDLIVMAAYAPLMVNVNPGGMQWSSDLIGYDAIRSYGSPSYYAQVLFANHLGDHTVKTTASGENPRFFWSATVSTAEKVLHLKLVNGSSSAQPLTLEIPNAASGSATVYTLHGASRWITNTIEHPDVIKPVKSSATWKPQLSHDVPANTIEVIDIPLK